MGRVRFFNSVRVKFVIIFVLLIFVAMQIIGVYFVRRLEQQQIANFKTAIEERVTMLLYDVQEEMRKTRSASDDSLESVLNLKLSDYDVSDISEMRVIDRNAKVLATSLQSNQDIVGKRSAEEMVNRTLTTGLKEEKHQYDEATGKRIWVLSEPIIVNKEVAGCLYTIAKIERVYSQVQDINNIMETGTIISLIVTAVLGLAISQMITRPISELRTQAVALSKGNYARRAKIYGNDEIGQLAATFNNLSRKLLDAQSTTDAEKRKLNSVLENMTDGVIATDRRGRVILINEPALKLLELSQEEVLSKPLVAVLDIEEEYGFEALLEQKESIILDYSDASRQYYLRAHFSPIQRETGFMNGLITVLHDITEQEKIEEERKEFVANVSHELRTPLTTIRSYLEALEDDAIENEELRSRFLGVARDETERMIRMVSDLLNLSRLENGPEKLTLRWIDFVKFLNRIVDRFEMTNRDRNVSFKREFPNKPVFVEIDPDKINQVIDNIISNALKYSPEGGQITIKITVFETMMEVSIRDQGMGMPKGNVEKIFRRFYRVDKARSRKMGGTGLGLAIAKEIINAHRGDIFARSIEGVGTTIIFSLPYENSQEDEWDA